MLPVCAEDGDDQFPLFVVMNILPWESRRSTFGGVIGVGNIDMKKDNVSRFDALFSSLTTRAGRANCCTAVEHVHAISSPAVFESLSKDTVSIGRL